jgi:ribonuclease P/MRP protein subunit RPP1
LRRFTDLHLRFPRGDLGELEEMLRLSSDLGYSTIAISFNQNMKDEIKRARAICSDLGIDLATRVDLEPNTAGELLRALKELRYRFEVIAVKCLTKPVARQAAKDRRVDLLNFPTEAAQRERIYFDRQEAVLASDSLSALEINASTILGGEPSRRSRLLAMMRKEIAEARRMSVPFILSSGAEDLYGLRSPRDLASLLALMGLDWELALDAVSEEPLKIVERNREKLKAGYVSPGVRVVGAGAE